MTGAKPFIGSDRKWRIEVWTVFEVEESKDHRLKSHELHDLIEEVLNKPIEFKFDDHTVLVTHDAELADIDVLNGPGDRYAGVVKK